MPSLSRNWLANILSFLRLNNLTSFITLTIDFYTYTCFNRSILWFYRFFMHTRHCVRWTEPPPPILIWTSFLHARYCGSTVSFNHSLKNTRSFLALTRLYFHLGIYTYMAPQHLHNIYIHIDSLRIWMQSNCYKLNSSY